MSTGWSPHTKSSSSDLKSTIPTVRTGGLKRQREISPEADLDEPAKPAIHINNNIFDPSVEDCSDGEESTTEKTTKSEGAQQNSSLEARKNLLNFFSFSDASKPLPEVAGQIKPSVGPSGPAPKLARVAHYNQHNEEEEVKYVEELRPLLEKPIPTGDPDGSTDSENDDSVDVERNLPKSYRYFRSRAEVFSKYDFERKSVDMSSLAAYQQKDKILQAIEENRVVIIDGFTGCGKTTQVPQFLIDRAFETKRPCNIIVTQPRRLAALAVARRVSEERCWELGTVVGYQVGMERRIGPDTLLTFMTVGVLLQKLTRVRSLRKFTHVIIDEVHERDLHTDLLLLFVKKILLEDTRGRERHVKLILMSATLNATNFSEYFSMQRNGEEIGATPVVKIPAAARRFKVDEIFLDDMGLKTEDADEFYGTLDKDKATVLPEIYRYALKTIIELDQIEGDYDPRMNKEVKNVEKTVFVKERGSVLVFLPGIMEIKTFFKILEDENRRLAQTTNDPNFYKWDIVPLHSSITNEEQRRVFQPPREFFRKIIISTNIAESSITVPDIVYVIDFCLTKSNCVDAGTNFSCLRICWASVNQCIQRKGRTGRVRDGKCYRMIPRKFFNELQLEAVPEMLKSALESVVLQIKTLDMGSPKEILCLALNPPDQSGIERAVANLKEVGAMTVLTTESYHVEHGRPKYSYVYHTWDGDLTFLGRIMSCLPISPQCTRLVLLGHCFGVLKEAIIIAAGLSGKSPFSTPFNRQLESYLQKLNWAKKTYSDCFAILYAYKTWLRQFGDPAELDGKKNVHEKQWSRVHFVQIPQMKEMRSMVEDIEDRLKQNGITPVHPFPDSGTDSVDISKEKALMLKVAIAGAFYPNYFHRPRPNASNFERESSREVNGQDQLSTVYYKGFPPGHCGMLYAKHVAEFLSHGLSFPSVKFEGQKVLAIFDRNGKKFGPIPEGVYLAVKKRQIREQLEFKILWKEDETLEYEKRVKEQQSRRFRRCPAQVGLPSIAVQKIAVCVCHVESPSQFWVISHMHVSRQNDMATIINEAMRSNTRNKKDVPRLIRERDLCVGALVLAPYVDESNDRNYYRARVLFISNLGKCLVYFIDYGNSDWIPVRELFDLSPSMVENGVDTTPALAVECRLSETAPGLIHGSVYPAAAITAFKDFVKNLEVMDLNIYAIHQSVIIGELYKRNPPPMFQGLSFNAWLKRNNFADHTPESYYVNENHEARRRYELMKDDPEQVRGHNARQVAESLERDYVEPPMYGKTPCMLRGAMSPLELNFQPMCYSSCSKSVNMDSHSVNSVILEQEPTKPDARVVVAASINIQERSGRVVARETTIMPAIPGMLALMSLVFTPRAELRCDPRMQRYTGALCGLGVDPVNLEPIYMDHDMEIVFDTVIDDSDIELINYIRYNMNVILRDNVGMNKNAVHRDLCEKMFNLLKRPRSRVDEEIYPTESHIWGRIPARSLIPASRTVFPVQPLDTFIPHSTIHLTPADPNVMTWDFAV